ncbi:ArsO family NAD(P)H-dependent flavin-containing monooxygenase [Nocardioides sambongensis]|uniref:ArsO family NAD(P)H-dependent flavin-containing monooxygenase n=1 Tax=Nocardioides sambongensis TaxID=2589074 RepID=UPI001E3E4399|nr:ArsO family NAD(P)H-dependent flavin-containing monooxygenase [Nocardioides sambongensis]
MTEHVDVVIVGGGQAGLATGFYLRRAGLRPGTDVVILDGSTEPGGAWAWMWDGLRTFSPASFSSLPGWMMPAWDETVRGYPTRQHVVDYLTRYEQRYDLEVRRGHRVRSVERSVERTGAGASGRLTIHTDTTTFAATAVVSVTGTWQRPFWPSFPGARDFRGRQLHAADYQRPEEFTDQHVVVVGGGNSAAQILAEISTVAGTTWVTQRPPRFLADDVDGRALFLAARQRIQALAAGRDHPGVGGLGDIVMIDSVKEARGRGVLDARPVFQRLTADGIAWADGTEQRADAVVWCTGFRPELRHLRPLHLESRAGIPLVGGPSGTQAVSEPRLHLVGYGDWTGPASATLAGVGPSARAAAAEIAARTS